jgi:hypothetical protein
MPHHLVPAQGIWLTTPPAGWFLAYCYPSGWVEADERSGDGQPQGLTLPDSLPQAYRTSLKPLQAAVFKAETSPDKGLFQDAQGNLERFACKDASVEGEDLPVPQGLSPVQSLLRLGVQGFLSLSGPLGQTGQAFRR